MGAIVCGVAAIFHKKSRGGAASIHVGSNIYAVGGAPDPDDKDRKKNNMTKSEFFKQDVIKKNYEYYRDGIYRRKKGACGIEKAEYLEWDHLHSDVEAYNVGKKHLGSIDPQKLKLYKGSVWNRDFPLS